MSKEKDNLIDKIKIEFNKQFNNSETALYWLEDNNYIEIDSDINISNYAVEYEYYINDKFVCKTSFRNYDSVLEVILDELSKPTVKKILKELGDN